MSTSTTKKSPNTTTAPAPAPAVATTQPDPNGALTALVAGAVAQLDAIEAQLGADSPVSPAAKRHALRMRKGGANVLGMIAALATQHQLESPAMQVAPMTADADRASTLQPLSNRLAALGKHVDDLIAQAQSSAWDVGLKFYAVMQRLAKSDGDLATAMEPVTQFFAFRHKKQNPPGTPTRRQRKATTKAVKALKRSAPGLLAGETATAPTPEPAAPEPAAPASPAPAPAPKS